ncbi:hypothetical protein NUW54_g10639 [Trametes sanguinea]|uniref:Uncharacterized protein n=1 Tax=Trametes sanguinea TaxID=158606 RepID=A0ACC1NVM9_9APHY|nr:hypothetical protein NUW54_g10639 [Trametes sanguinea]
MAFDSVDPTMLFEGFDGDVDWFETTTTTTSSNHGLSPDAFDGFVDDTYPDLADTFMQYDPILDWARTVDWQNVFGPSTHEILDGSVYSDSSTLTSSEDSSHPPTPRDVPFDSFGDGQCAVVSYSCAFDIAVEYVHDRKQFGQPVGEFQLMQGKIADMYTKLNASRSYVYAVARAATRARSAGGYDCAGAILYSSDRAVEVALEAMQCLGGNGYINDYPTGRILRDARLYTVGAGTQEIRRMLIGREFNDEFRRRAS